jgi:hypothetical protein
MASDMAGLVERLAQTTVENVALRQASRETFEAMVAMRDSINEHVPIPSLESDLAKGPSDTVFCEVVARAVIAEITRLHGVNDSYMKLAVRAEEQRDEARDKVKGQAAEIEQLLEGKDKEWMFTKDIDRLQDAEAKLSKAVEVIQHIYDFGLDRLKVERFLATTEKPNGR